MYKFRAYIYLSDVLILAFPPLLLPVSRFEKGIVPLVWKTCVSILCLRIWMKSRSHWGFRYVFFNPILGLYFPVHFAIPLVEMTNIKYCLTNRNWRRNLNYWLKLLCGSHNQAVALDIFECTIGCMPSDYQSLPHVDSKSAYWLWVPLVIRCQVTDADMHCIIDNTMALPHDDVIKKLLWSRSTATFFSDTGLTSIA